MGLNISLREAIALYQKEDYSSSNSYNWWREIAKRDGEITIENIKFKVFKYKNTWSLDKTSFLLGLNQIRENHLENMTKRKLMTSDYENGIIHGMEGESISTDWGGYRISGNFHFYWNTNHIMRSKSNGSWKCNKCMKVAEIENNKPECHLCSDWNGCKSNCTLSKILCRSCNLMMDI